MIKRKYVSLTVIAVLLCLALLRLASVNVPMLYVCAPEGAAYDVDAAVLRDLREGRRPLVVLADWARPLRQAGLRYGDLLVADDLAELKLFLRDRPDVIALIPWYGAEPALRTLRLDGVYFWEAAARRQEYPLSLHRFSLWGLPRYRPRRVRHIALGGAVVLSREVVNVVDRASDVNYPWQGVAEILSAADLALVQLQSPLVYNYVNPRSADRLYGKAAYAAGLNYAGIDLVHLSGAHLGDAGVLGLRDTLDILAKRNIKHLGVAAEQKAAYAPQFFDLRGLRVAVLPQGGVSAQYTETDLRGRELTYYTASGAAPDAALRQALASDLLIILSELDAGGRAVFFEGGRFYDERYKPAYRLGGLIFGQTDRETDGLIQRYFVYGKRVAAVDVLPVFLNDQWYTEISAEPRRVQKALSRIIVK